MASQIEKNAFFMAFESGTEDQRNNARNLYAGFRQAPSRLRSDISKLKEKRKISNDIQRRKIDFEIAQKESRLKKLEEEMNGSDFFYNLIKGIFGL